jgi:hypothetical protein
MGPDSLPPDGVPTGEVRGPLVLPSQADPGWRDHPVSTDINDAVERSFNGPKKK